MSLKKPTYLGTLNAIVNGERRGYAFLNAWSEVTPNADLASRLKMVALREAEHAATFEKRLWELGFPLERKKDPKFKTTMEIASSNLTDKDKFEQLGVGQPPEEGEDRLLKLLADQSIDPQTAALLGRFIAEERDSGRILREANQITQALIETAEPGAAPKNLDEQATVNASLPALADIQLQLHKLIEIVSDLQATAGVPKSKVRAVK